MTAQGASSAAARKKNVFLRLKRDIFRNPYLYIMLLPVFAFYIIFHYMPMYGAVIAFKDFWPGDTIWGAKWVGLANFRDFFNAYYFWRLLRNTMLLSFYNIIFGFPAPIILALLLNEIHRKRFKKVVQTITYLPHFISMVVTCSIILNFFSRTGLVNQILGMFGGEAIPFMISPQYFRSIYVGSNIWQEVGWGSIIYIASLSRIDQELYEACQIDGGGRLRQLISITIPGIAPTIIIMLILRVGRMMNIGHEKILLLYNSNTYETADIISTFVYRKGLMESNYSASAAIGLFNSVINFILLMTVNKISARVSETSLW